MLVMSKNNKIIVALIGTILLLLFDFETHIFGYEPASTYSSYDEYGEYVSDPEMIRIRRIIFWVILPLAVVAMYFIYTLPDNCLTALANARPTAQVSTTTVPSPAASLRVPLVPSPAASPSSFPSPSPTSHHLAPVRVEDTPVPDHVDDSGVSSATVVARPVDSLRQRRQARLRAFANAIASPRALDRTRTVARQRALISERETPEITRFGQGVE